MKERTKEILKDGFGSLVNNAAAIRGAKNGPLWLTILFFIFGILLPIIPLFVAQATTNGSYFLKNYSYGLERYVTSMAMDLKDNGVEFGIDEEHLLTVSENGTPVDFSTYGSSKPYATYLNEVTNQYDFVLYISDAETNAEKTVVNNAITTTYYEAGSINKTESAENVYVPSYIILFKNGVYVAILNKDSIKVAAYSYNGDYKTIKANDKCLETLLNVTDKDGNAVTPSIISNEYTEGVYNNFKKFLDKSYETLKVKNTWVSSAIYLGIFFGLNIIMGFLMWLLTRGKNNPNNYYTPWLTEKVQARMCLAPALITLIVGFFLTSQTMLIYIVTIGMRVMWASMKELRPIQQ